jgi:glutamyl-tRNA synthetase/nondiscriminating glutamyl-tRNA synthetase
MVPAGRDVTFKDIVRGDVTFNTEVIGDPVIVRSGGRPAYNFAVVVDDAEMGVTHVVRGEDHISNTPRQILLYEALGLSAPAFAHLSLVLGPDHAPLSKRHGATSVAEFRERGYLPEALVNYLALLGWSPGENLELMSIEEMVRRFDLSHVSHSAAVFDTDKLAWMNRHYMKEASPSRLAREALKYFARAGFVTVGTDISLGYVESLLPMAVGSVDRIEEIPERVAFVFDWDARRAAELVRQEPDGPRAVLAFANEIQEAGALDRDAFRAAAGRARAATGLKGRALFHPLRVALTAAESGPELDLAVPAIDRGAALSAGSGLMPIASCAERAREAVAALDT